jgi:hypothetical protein
MFKKRYSGSYDRYLKTSAPQITIPQSYTTGQKRRPNNKVYIALIVAAAVAVALFFLLRGCGGSSGNARNTEKGESVAANNSGTTGKSGDENTADVNKGTTDTAVKKIKPKPNRKEDPGTSGTNTVEKAGSAQPQPRKKVDLGTHVEIITK